MANETRLSTTQMNMIIAAILASGTMAPNASADQVVTKYRKVLLAMRPEQPAAPVAYKPAAYRPGAGD